MLFLTHVQVSGDFGCRMTVAVHYQNWDTSGEHQFELGYIKGLHQVVLGCLKESKGSGHCVVCHERRGRSLLALPHYVERIVVSDIQTLHDRAAGGEQNQVLLCFLSQIVDQHEAARRFVGGEDVVYWMVKRV